MGVLLRAGSVFDDVARPRKAHTGRVRRGKGMPIVYNAGRGGEGGAEIAGQHI